MFFLSSPPLILRKGEDHDQENKTARPKLFTWFQPYWVTSINLYTMTFLMYNINPGNHLNEGLRQWRIIWLLWVVMSSVQVSQKWFCSFGQRAHLPNQNDFHWEIYPNCISISFYHIEELPLHWPCVWGVSYQFRRFETSSEIIKWMYRNIKF